MSTYKAAEFAKLAGVSVKTLRRWDREGLLKAASPTPGNRRRHTQEQLNTLLQVEFKGERVTIAYVWVSSQAQKGDLTDQKMALEGPGGGFSAIGENTKAGDILIHIDSDNIEADLKKSKSLGAKIVRERSENSRYWLVGRFQRSHGKHDRALYKHASAFIINNNGRSIGSPVIILFKT